MAQFNYFNDINSLFSMDRDPQKGALHGANRWQRKLDSSHNNSTLNGSNINTSKLSISFNNGLSLISVGNISTKTPQKNNSLINKGRRTPNSKSPSRKTLTPNKINVKTPTGGDRFIPNRSTSNFELGHFLIKQEMHKQIDENTNFRIKDNTNRSPQPTDRQKLLAETLQGGNVENRKILSYKEKPPNAPEFHQNPLRVIYSIKTPMSAKSGTRYIPHSPERILDAPEIINDYYLNLMDWSADNIVTVALGKVVYLWNAATGNIEQLREYENNDHACSLSWIQEGHILAMGTNEGTVELWDCEKKKRLRVMDGHAARVGALSWNSYIVTSGSRDGSIVHHDVRQRDHNVAKLLNGHSQEVCGLKWSTDFKYLASGGNDNIVNVWPSITGFTSETGGLASMTNLNEPLYVFNEHQAAVRALAWSPWQSNVLATGGGTADRCIKFWNINTGTLINSIDSKSQVCALLWSKTYKELISAHGYANNQLTIWKYPSMSIQAELTGHTSRVLQIAMSPDGSTVMSAAADETLRLWNCFAPDPNQVKKEKAAIRMPSSVFRSSIR